MAWVQGAMALGGTLANSLDIGGNRLRRKQVEQQQKLTDIQTDANKELANHGMGISKEMFDYTGYGAQRKQMEEAGLNPALMYGHAGAGGQTASAGAGSAGMGQASDEASQKMARTQAQGMALQLSKLSSEIAINKAQARKLETEADKTAGVDTELAKANISDITQDIENKQVQRAGYILQNDFDRVRNYINENTAEMSIEYMSKQLDQMNYEIGLLSNNKDISDATLNDVINSFKLQNENLIVDILSKEQGIEMSKEQIKKMVQDIAQGWEGLRIQDKSVSVAEKANKIKEKYPSMNQVGGRVLNDVVNVSEKIDNWVSKLFKGEFNRYYDNK